MLGEPEFSLQVPAEELKLTVRRFPRELDATERELARIAAIALRFGLEAPEPGVLELAEGLDRALEGTFARLGREPSVAREPDPSRSFRAFATALAARLAEALHTGRITVERRLVDSLTERDDGPPPSLPPLPPAERERAETFFEVRFVDEIGSAISGLDVELDTDGAPHDVATNAAGVALLQNVVASSAAVTAPDPKALDAILDPRWTTKRAGSAPKEGNTTVIVFEGGQVGPVSVKAAVPNTVVVKPPSGLIFLRLVDKTGRVPHKNRKYTLDGPQSFSGTTDEQGLLHHESVFPGDYTLELTLEFFEGDARQTDVYETQVVVLPAASGTPETRMLGVVPASILVRTRLFFNTNKAFLLPTALPGIGKLREFYLENNPSKLLVVGHADTAGDPAFNDALSLDRAEATIAFLKDDVDAWLAYYDTGVAKKKRWGKAEDRMMLVAMPDFADKPKGTDAVRWFQETRGLTVDGKAGPETRRRLVTEYMALDGSSLSEAGIDIDATAHGCGENFPLTDDGESLDDAPEDDQHDPGDRRAELFFFDPEFGILPPPPGKNSKPGSTEYPTWRDNAVEVRDLVAPEALGAKVRFIELIDALFRTNSAVVLPEGEAPSRDEGALESLTSVGIFATVLRYNEEQPGARLLVAGHTDTTGTVEFNQTLSEERAACALALLLGGAEQRERFKTLCDSRHTVADYKQILAWVSRAFEDLTFDCDPGTIDDNAATGVEPVRRFQKAYNLNKAALGATAPDLATDGDIGPLTWGAIFDCYDFALEQELGEDRARVEELREALVFADPERKSLGFSEYFPIEELGVDDFKSQANRRVEILFFDAGEEPDLVAAENDPETTELYLPGFFERTPLEPMLSAKPWRAAWVDADRPGRSDQTRIARVDAPGLPAGTPVTFVVTASIDGEDAEGFSVVEEVIAVDGAAELVFGEWFDGSMLPDDTGAEALSEFPQVEYSFTVDGGGRLVTSPVPLPYADTLRGVLVHAISGEKAPELPYQLVLPWGFADFTTDEQGRIEHAELPPGGALVVARDSRLVAEE